MTYDDAVLAEGAARLGLPLDERQRASFARYYALLAAENVAAGITTVIDPEGVQRRHFLESMAVLPALAAHGFPLGDGTRLIDVGSGGGFPGAVLAIVVPGLRATLLESHGRRAAFLARLIEALGLAARVRAVCARAEDAARIEGEREAYDIAVARALAPLAALAELMLPFVRPGGMLAAIKGSRAPDEVVEAGAAIAALGGGEAELAPLTVPEATAHAPVLVLVRKLRPTPDRYPRRAGVPQRRPLR